MMLFVNHFDLILERVKCTLFTQGIRCHTKIFNLSFTYGFLKLLESDIKGTIVCHLFFLINIHRRTKTEE